MTAVRTREEWQRQADALVVHGQAFIDGRYVDAAQGGRFACISPIDGRVLAQVADCTAADVER
ncbi:MAG: aldehyde dehydrogenase PuuC, partial [Pseudomonadales bacterium]